MHTGDKASATAKLNVGAIIVATGFTLYEPREGEYGWGMPGVVTLKDFRQMPEAGDSVHG